MVKLLSTKELIKNPEHFSLVGYWINTFALEILTSGSSLTAHTSKSHLQWEVNSIDFYNQKHLCFSRSERPLQTKLCTPQCPSLGFQS